MKVSNSKLLRRTGFSKISETGDWSIEKGTLYWKGSANTSIMIDHLPKIEPEVTIEPCPVNRKRAKEIVWRIGNRHKLTAVERYLTMMWALVMPKELFFKIGAKLLPSGDWTDSEKLFFIWNRLPRLSGFEDGEKVHQLLASLRWNEKLFRERMSAFYIAARKYRINGDDTEWQLALDEKSIQNLSGQTILYRGFNIPSMMSIRDRDINRWMKQASGQSVYFTIDENVARRFACIQKYQMIKIGHASGMYSPDMMELIGGKLAVAKYRVSIDDVILYDDVLGRCEGECICLPEKVDLLNYKFLGFDDFMNILKAKPPRKVHNGISPVTGEKLV